MSAAHSTADAGRTAHTPGPWSTDGVYVIGIDGQTVADCGKSGTIHRREQIANAQQIAELPTMIARLEEIESMPFSMVNDSDSLRHTIRAMQAIARAALAAAKGAK
ncbi:MAG: hypothetical protein WC100_12025 [Sterolibacterium sp.]